MNNSILVQHLAEWT